MAHLSWRWLVLFPTSKSQQLLSVVSHLCLLLQERGCVLSGRGERRRRGGNSRGGGGGGGDLRVRGGELGGRRWSLLVEGIERESIHTASL